MFRGQLFAGRLYIAQLWANAGSPAAGGDPWTRLPRDTQVWTPV